MNLKMFNAFTAIKNPTDPYGNRTYPRLEIVSFNYHAHCCQMRTHTYYRYIPTIGRRRREMDQGPLVRREALSGNTGGHVCVNVTARECVSVGNMSAVTMQTAAEFCSQLTSCWPCLESVCPSVCGSSVSGGGSGIGISSTVSSEIVCIEQQPTPTPTAATFTTQINRTVCTSVSATASPSPSPSPVDPCSDDYCASVDPGGFCHQCRTVGCSLSTQCEHDFPQVCSCTRRRKRDTPSVMADPLLIRRHLPEGHGVDKRSTADDSLLPAGCSIEAVEAVCRSISAAVTPTPHPTPHPSPFTGNGAGGEEDTTAPPTVDYCSDSYCDGTSDRDFCSQCLQWACGGPTSFCSDEFPEVCHCNRRKRSESTLLSDDMLDDPSSLQRRRRSVDNSSNSTSNMTLPDGYFYLDPNSTDIVCTYNNFTGMTAATPTTPTAGPTTSTTATPSQDPNTGRRPACPGALVFQETFVLSDNVTVCLPGNDDFNPCEDLLGDSHVLRVFIWLVIILALGGNVLVVIVFVGYSVIIRRTKQELFLVHFLYFNLAVADLLMGIYLFAIAIVDLRTLGEFSIHDINWRTGSGCDFVGFCAIASTMMSMYTLIVITLERMYTITFVMHRKIFKKPVAVIVMVVGWVFAVIVGILPLVGVSSYRKVAVCLPFDVQDPVSLGYVTFLLLVTGLGFVIILVSYCIIFYQAVLSPSKRRLVRSSAVPKWQMELKLALRMGFLVFTNLICWFPIALLGLTAAFGHPLIDVPTSKVFIVFVFPFNACLNPLLYSFSSKVFRENLCLMLGKCGLFSKYNRHIREVRAGVTPSVSSARSSQPFHSSGGTFIERFRLLSISSRGSSVDPSRRRDSAISQASTEDSYRHLIASRRCSNFSNDSNDDFFRVRRGSSGGLLEDQTTSFANHGFRSSSPISSTPREIIKPPRQKISASSLGPVPEEGEIPIAPTPTNVKINPAYCEADDEETYYEPNTDTEKGIENGTVVQSTTEPSMVGRNGVITPEHYSQHRIFSENSLFSEVEEGKTSSVSPGSSTDEVKTTVISTDTCGTNIAPSVEIEIKKEEVHFD